MLICIEDIIANSLIELKQRENINYITITKAESYGSAVVNKLRLEGYDARLNLEKYSFDEFKEEYSKYFDTIETGTNIICYIKEGITVEDLENTFRGYLSVDALLAFIDDEIVSKTLLPKSKKLNLNINKKS